MRVLNFKLFVVFITASMFVGCSGPISELKEIRVHKYPIDSTLTPNDSLLNFIQPYRLHLNEVLDTPLSFTPELLTKNDGELNSSLGNLLADLVLEAADTLSKRKMGFGVDFALLNSGGIRNVISAGPVSERTAYEVMPFENTIVIVTLEGDALKELIEYLTVNSTPHPISGIQLVLNRDGTLNSSSIRGKTIDFDKKYRVATSNFLAGGGDGMEFFKSDPTPLDTGYLIRNAMTDYFKRTDTLSTKPDNRFYQIAK